jgi:hypothetical protein
MFDSEKNTVELLMMILKKMGEYIRIHVFLFFLKSAHHTRVPPTTVEIAEEEATAISIRNCLGRAPDLVRSKNS